MQSNKANESELDISSDYNRDDLLQPGASSEDRVCE